MCRFKEEKDSRVGEYMVIVYIIMIRSGHGMHKSQVSNLTKNETAISNSSPEELCGRDGFLPRPWEQNEKTEVGTISSTPYDFFFHSFYLILTDFFAP
jgi:hypothetical protein